MARMKAEIAIDEIRERLNPLFKDKGLQLVLLFGSVVTGKMHKRSDIDLAFLFDKPADILLLTNKIIRLLHADNIDVVDLKHASPLLKFSIVKNSALVYEKEPGIFNEFYSLAFRRYIDTKKMRIAQAKAIEFFLQARGM